MNCVHCNKEFELKAQNQLYCSKYCQHKYRNIVLKSRKVNNCIVCNTPTHNPKFCSSSCSATYNNHEYPKRIKLVNSCIVCGNATEPKRKRCKSCYKQLKESGSIQDNKTRLIKICLNCNEEFLGVSYSKYCSRECRKNARIKNTAPTRNPVGLDITLKEATYEYLHKSSAFALVRSRGKTVARNHGLNKICSKCGYSKHVETCHIKAISEFEDSALLSEINSPDNLIGLCPNCHWEFDNGLLVIQLRPFSQHIKVI